MEELPSPFNKQAATAWIQSQLIRLNIPITGEIEEPHTRPWSAVWRVPTGGGDIYFKATPSILVYEPALTQALSQRFPGQIPPVLAADLAQGWMLLSDGGQRLREILRGEGHGRRWETILPQYAALQIALIDDLDPLLDAGMPDRRLDKLPQLFEQILADTGMLLLDQPDGITAVEYETLQEFVPQMRVLCDQLAGYGVPHSINHGDLHDGNIFVENGRYIFFDWGDCSAAHPFFSLRTTFVGLENSLHVAEDDPLFDHLARIYLASWSEFDTMDNLLAAFAIARRLWAMSSMLVWYNILSRLTLEQWGAYPEQWGAYETAVPSLLQELLTANNLV